MSKTFTDDQIDEVSVAVQRSNYNHGRPIRISAGNGCEDGSASISVDTAVRFAHAILEVASDVDLGRR